MDIIIEKPVASEKIVVTPSKLHQFVFCGRQVWFDYYLQFKKPLKQRIRMFIGKILHYIHHLFRLDYEKEKLLSVEIPELDVVLIGKPDSYKVSDNVIYIEEFKSTRQPRSLNRWGLQVWESDMVQSVAYAYILHKLYGKPVTISVRYIDNSVTFSYDEKMETILMLYIEQYKKMIETKILPDVSRNKRCNSCIYKEICDTIDTV